jgi:hypothetical protein
LYYLAGKVGISISELYELTPREFASLARGRLEAQKELFQSNSEMQRMMTLILVNTQIKKPIQDPKKLLQFGWEIQKAPKLSDEEIKKIKELWQ